MMTSCEHQVYFPVDYNITLDKENTYLAGEPVRFNFKGEVDNVLFYSGETGHQYKVAGDKGVVIKNLQNYMDSYEYVWNDPGTYTATFVGTNSNIEGSSEQVMEFTVTIMDNQFNK